jgi:hypothetical protein
VVQQKARRFPLRARLSRERVTGVEPATLCLANASPPVTTPSHTIPRSELRGSNSPLHVVGWARMGTSYGTHPVHTQTSPQASAHAPNGRYRRAGVKHGAEA